MILAMYAYLTGSSMPYHDLQFDKSIIIKGIVSGALLYLIFLGGFTIFKPILEAGAMTVYVFKNEASPCFIATTLIVTSFCEEYFWRRYTQTTLIKNFGVVKGIIFTSIAYSMIHLPTLNLPLVCAAFVAGLFWGTMYYITDSFWVIAISHLVWTELIFVLLPLT
jgi:membrane protease YdiL (CAAX protease family)